MHEDLSRKPQISASSERAFGLVWTCVLAIYGVLPLRKGGYLRLWSLALAVALLLVSLCAPRLLSRPNALWAKLALLLHRIVNPIAMGILFYGFFVPLGLFNRMRGKDPLRLLPDPGASTYWIKREPPGPSAASMWNQF